MAKKKEDILNSLSNEVVTPEKAPTKRKNTVNNKLLVDNNKLDDTKKKTAPRRTRVSETTPIGEETKKTKVKEGPKKAVNRSVLKNDEELVVDAPTTKTLIREFNKDRKKANNPNYDEIIQTATSENKMMTLTDNDLKKGYIIEKVIDDPNARELEIKFPKRKNYDDEDDDRKGKKKKEKDKKKQLMRVTTARGLSTKMVEERVALGLTNKTKQTKTKSVFSIIFHNVFTVLNFINVLMFLWLFSVGSYQNTLFMFIIAINTIIGCVQEIRAKKIIDSLSIVNTPNVEVMRNGRISRIKSEEVVLDDIVYYHTGKQICADSIVRKGFVEVNESMLTGESEVVLKKVGSPLYAGSYVVSGECYAKVEKVGKENYIAQLSSQVKKYNKPKSEIMKSLKTLINIITIIVIGMAVAVTYVNYEAALELYPNDTHMAYVKAVEATSGSVIGMIPSGLFLMTSVSLAVGVIRLSKQRTIVQDMYCIEMLARVDVMCLDKTGTITDGTMKVKEVLDINPVKTTVKQIISVIQGMMKDDTPTSIALQKRFGVNKKTHYRYSIPFSSLRKFTAVYFDDHECTYMLGAPEFVLKENYADIEYDVYRYSKLGYRVLLLASSPDKCTSNDMEFSNVTPHALIAIEDTIRKDAVETIDYFKKSGVAVKVISGDNPVTVSKIAKRAGIDDADKYISLEDRGEDDLEEVVRNYTVFGRVSPEQKKLIIQILKEDGHTVAMTGDGVNDILALKEADCSIAMANGSDAVRDVSHLVLLDSTFSSMPRVVMEGRRVVNNIKRLSTMFLTKTIFSFLLSVVFIIINHFKPITYPIQPIYLLPFDWFIVWIPSAYLAIESNNKRIKGKFLSDVLLNAIPGALLIVLNYLVISLLGPVYLDMTTEMVTSCTVYNIFIVGVLVLTNIFKPFDLKRIIVFILDIILLITMILVSPVFPFNGGTLAEMLGLYTINVESILLLIIIYFYSRILLNFFNKLINEYKEFQGNFKQVKSTKDYY